MTRGKGWDADRAVDQNLNHPNPLLTRSVSWVCGPFSTTDWFLGRGTSFFKGMIDLFHSVPL